MAKENYHHGDLRAALLNEAERLLKMDGIEKLSLRKIASQAGVSHAAPSHHFGNANGLITALTVIGYQRLSKGLSDVVNTRHADGLDPRISCGIAYIDFALDHPELFSLMFASEYPDFDNKELDRASMEAFTTFLQVASGDDSPSANRPHDIDVPLMAYWSKMHGLAILLLTGRMRSVLSLSKKKRRTAIADILEYS